MKNSTFGGKKDGPRRRAVRVWLDEEDFKLLEENAQLHYRTREEQTKLLLLNAIRASWAYGHSPCRNFPGVTSARDFVSDMYRLQARLLAEIEGACNAAKNASSAAAKECQYWLDAEKVRRVDSAAASGLKVIDGKFGPAPKGSAS